MKRQVRVALLDDHPEILERLDRIIGAQVDLEVVGTARSEGQLWPVMLRNRPDVVVLDEHHRGRNGVALCFDIKRWPHAPAIIIHAAFTDEALAVAAALAGAGAVVSKSSRAPLLIETIRELARSPLSVVRISSETRDRVTSHLDESDQAILALRLTGEHPARIAHELGLRLSEVNARIETMIAGLKAMREAA
jgi:DNA-binding NarL/FixJ family response regulator